jgi:hypothetical protein
MLGALPSGLSHLSNQASLGSNSLGGSSSGTSANPSVQTPGGGPQPQSQGLLTQGGGGGGQTPVGQAGQNVYGMVPGTYVPGYMGQMGMGGVGGYGMGGMGYFGRDR